VRVTLTITGPDGGVETLEGAPAEGERTFEFDRPQGGTVFVEIDVSDGAGASASGALTVSLSPCEGEAQPPAVTLGAEDDGAMVELMLGQVLELALGANPSTGYGWQIEQLDPDVLFPLGGPEFTPESDLPGAGGVQRFRFEAIGVGETTLGLAYRRPWEEGVEPLETFTASVTVR
jgi:inhibitor of cysteine peptidase